MKKLVLVGLLMMAGFPAVVRADEGPGCATTLADCYRAAARIDSFWYRWAAGIDCELDFIECSRRKIMGR